MYVWSLVLKVKASPRVRCEASAAEPKEDQNRENVRSVKWELFIFSAFVYGYCVVEEGKETSLVVAGRWSSGPKECCDYVLMGFLRGWLLF